MSEKLKEALHTAAVIGHHCDDRSVNLVGGIVARLCEIDATLIQFADEEDEGLADRSVESNALLDEAGELMGKLDIRAEVYYCDERPEDGGRLRIEIPGTPYDGDGPLYLSGGDSSSPTDRPRGC